MMTGYLICANGQRLALPPFTGLTLKRTGGVPCDSFEGTCPWDMGRAEVLDSACRLVLEEDGARRFTGVLDEYELTWDGGGGVLSLSARGLAALLLDNEAAGQDYQVATLADILRDHVAPYDVPVGRVGSLPPVSGFSVETGSSQWQVLYDFARYHGGVEPRFDAYGSLTVDGGWEGRQLSLDDRAGVTEILWRDKRYGVYSEILVQDRGDLSPRRVVNEDFTAQGGRCRKVVTMPGRSTYQAMRYSGQFQLEQSAAERFRLELTLPGSYFCEPGDVLSVSLTKPALSGVWTVLETKTMLDSGGTRVKLTLGSTPDALRRK